MIISNDPERMARVSGTRLCGKKHDRSGKAMLHILGA